MSKKSKLRQAQSKCRVFHALQNDKQIVLRGSLWQVPRLARETKKLYISDWVVGALVRWFTDDFFPYSRNKNVLKLLHGSIEIRSFANTLTTSTVASWI